MNKIVVFLMCLLVSGNYALAGELESSSTKPLIGEHVANLKSSIEKKCQKIQRKIEKLESKLAQLDKQDVKESAKLKERIQSYQDAIDALKIIQLSAE